MQHDSKKALDWLSWTTSVALLWTPGLIKASCRAAAEGRVEVLAYLLEAVRETYAYGHHAPGELYFYELTAPNDSGSKHH